MMNIRRIDSTVWRSMLYVPATNEKFIETAHKKEADAIKIDLEDSVKSSEKPRARERIRSAAKAVSKSGADVLIRINRPLRMAVQDIEASVWPEVTGLVLPKTESSDHIGFISEIIAELEYERGMINGHIKLMALIETPRGYNNVRQIAKSSPRLCAIALGQEDFSAEMGIFEPRGVSLLNYLQNVQVAAREARIIPIGYPGLISDFTNLELFESNVIMARKLGFEGGSCIHPKQVSILNKAFTPTHAEIERSEQIIAAYSTALASGEGVIALEGKMIDLAIVARAKRILATRDSIYSKLRKQV